MGVGTLGARASGLGEGTLALIKLVSCHSLFLVPLRNPPQAGENFGAPSIILRYIITA